MKETTLEKPPLTARTILPLDGKNAPKPGTPSLEEQFAPYKDRLTTPEQHKKYIGMLEFEERVYEKDGKFIKLDSITPFLPQGMMNMSIDRFYVYWVKKVEDKWVRDTREEDPAYGTEFLWCDEVCKQWKVVV